MLLGFNHGFIVGMVGPDRAPMDTSECKQGNCYCNLCERCGRDLTRLTHSSPSDFGLVEVPRWEVFCEIQFANCASGGRGFCDCSSCQRGSGPGWQRVCGHLRQCPAEYAAE